MTNKILKASLSHYQAQRDFFLSELDIIINRSNNEGDTKKAIDLIRELSLTVVCINNIESIIEDNKSNVSMQNIEDLNHIAQILDDRIKNPNNNQQNI
jgi:5-bromo-4-chloroindolyl phosphate hydrolysis protein